MKNRTVSFYGYNDSKAMEIYNCINLFILLTVIAGGYALYLALAVKEEDAMG